MVWKVRSDTSVCLEIKMKGVFMDKIGMFREF